MEEQRFIDALNRYADMMHKWNEFHDALVDFAKDYPSEACQRDVNKQLIELLGNKAFEVDCLLNHHYFCNLDQALMLHELTKEELN